MFRDPYLQFWDQTPSLLVNLGHVAGEILHWPVSCPLVNIQKTSKNYGTSSFFMGQSTISMAIFNSYAKLPEGNLHNGIHQSSSTRV